MSKGIPVSILAITDSKIKLRLFEELTYMRATEYTLPYGDERQLSIFNVIFVFRTPKLATIRYFCLHEFLRDAQYKIKLASVTFLLFKFPNKFIQPT